MTSESERLPGPGVVAVVGIETWMPLCPERGSAVGTELWGAGHSIPGVQQDGRSILQGPQALWGIVSLQGQQLRKAMLVGETPSCVRAPVPREANF